MILSSLALLAQLAAAQPTAPVLTFPEPGLDDSAAYQGYETRLYRDAARNTVQIYLDGREGRVVHLWADALNESLGFTARDADGKPAPLRWTATDARIGRHGSWRVLEHALVADTRAVRIGLVLLGSMRVERDLQYAGRQRAPLGERPFRVAEVDRMLAAIESLPPAERRSQLALLHAGDMRAAYARLEPTVTIRPAATRWIARFAQPSLDARDSLALEIEVDPRLVQATRDGRTLTLRARSGDARVPFTVRVATTGAALTPLAREEIFTPEFLSFLGDAARTGNERARWLEREVRGVELLSSREKLMAGLPTYATYFGRDMMVSALMMRSIWRPAMSEAVIGSVLRKLGPAGDVSHEEALGGQAIREAAAEYARLLGSGGRDSLARATAVLRNAARTRENYHMIDDEFHLPVLTARWIVDSAVSAAHKRAFLLDSSDGGGTRAARLLKELALVSRMTAAYARDQRAENLVPFAPRDTGWASQSWRDSGVGYANGRWPMDVNAIWAPHALEAMGRILDAYRALGIPVDGVGEPLATYAKDPSTLRAAVDAWRGAARHFVVRLSPAEVRQRVTARLAAMPAEERAWWTQRVAATGADRDSLEFLALSLDAGGRPVGVANTDPATGLFLGGEDDATALRDARLFARAYPVGLLVDGVGPVVANDAYATPPVWGAFVRDAYHGPRVVWGREVNLFLLGVARHVAAQRDTGGAVARELRDAARAVRDAVAASGFHSELWSYGFDGGRPVPRRYGSGADVQLWSTTDLAVQFALWRLGL
ncbi:hypothetical protein J421_6272 (plasmid) [Gemmatirosa kalamazoonensis]|uniref:Uncharacterized protein n=1 Tax=Gemmatirosa kalamazoonensis TaxID=861299 RepID=W0RTN0_9BACT|nr:hypothetical protein [Gemmatirosa kalamazoonensis]AHG93807.1 hypothetical protein J421_6272 [Gemmatirosa kalamazoonensis]